MLLCPQALQQRRGSGQQVERGGGGSLLGWRHPHTVPLQPLHPGAAPRLPQLPCKADATLLSSGRTHQPGCSLRGPSPSGTPWARPRNPSTPKQCPGLAAWGHLSRSRGRGARRQPQPRERRGRAGSRGADTILAPKRAGSSACREGTVGTGAQVQAGTWAGGQCGEPRDPAAQPRSAEVLSADAAGGSSWGHHTPPAQAWGPAFGPSATALP